ncbi:MAG: M20/M25/M40 family metallo-hydrolase [Vicinamibacterales bacterium]
MTRLTAGLVLAALCAVPLLARAQADDDALRRIRAEGLERSQVAATFAMLTTTIGPRLTASPAHRRAIEWTQAELRKYGLANVHAEPWAFGRGWTLERFSIEMLSPRYLPLIGYPKAWSPSTKGRIAGTPLWLPEATAERLGRPAEDLSGRIVMTAPQQSFLVREDRAVAGGDFRPPAAARSRLNRDEQQALASALHAAGAAVTLEPNYGQEGTVFVTGRDAGDEVPPGVVLAAEHYNLVARLLEAGEDVRLAVDVQVRFNDDDPNAYNVVAEIPGTDPDIGGEIVMAGAHLDSWHSAAGATDNADGVATLLEAMRILKAAGVQPRRTIRVALWGGEEQGLLGSRAYVAEHLTGPDKQAERERYSVYFNLDNGYPPITGFYLEGHEAVQPIVSRSLEPLRDLGATIATTDHIGATDHLSFLAVGIPGFQAVQNYVDYDTRTHHTNMDTPERVADADLRQASVVMATVLYEAAMRDEKLPRK